MAKERLSMRKIKEILRLKWACSLEQPPNWHQLLYFPQYGSGLYS